MEPIPDTAIAAAEPLLAQANLARIRGQWTEAVDICVRVLRSHPGNADAHSLLGDIYRDQGATDDAIQWYRMAVDLRAGGPDEAKLRKLEQERERRTAQSSLLAPQAVVDEGGAAGTAQLMGYSPKRWLNTLTIVSACFLAATLIVLGAMRFGAGGRPDPLPQSMQLSSHPMMPTAETGVKLPAVNPNRPTLLPAGDHPQTAPKIHETGTGLEPDHPTTSRTTPLPTFTQPQGPDVSPQTAVQNQEIPPAPVQLIQPINTSVSVSPDGPAGGQERLSPSQTGVGQQDPPARGAGAGAANGEPAGGASAPPVQPGGPGAPASSDGLPPER